MAPDFDQLDLFEILKMQSIPRKYLLALASVVLISLINSVNGVRKTINY